MGRFNFLDLSDSFNIYIHLVDKTWEYLSSPNNREDKLKVKELTRAVMRKHEKILDNSDYDYDESDSDESDLCERDFSERYKFSLKMAVFLTLGYWIQTGYHDATEDCVATAEFVNYCISYELL